MTKNNKRGLVVLLVIFVLFTVISFAPPFSKNIIFVMAYISGLISILLQLYTFRKGFDNDNIKSQFYGFPVARISVIYLITQLIVSLIEMILASILPMWLVLIINVVILGASVLGFIGTDLMRDEIEKQEVKLSASTNNTNKMKIASLSLLNNCSNNEVKKELETLDDIIKYSDTVTTPETENLEEEIINMMNDIKDKLTSLNTNEIISDIEKIKNKLNERNGICKLSKK